MDSNVTPGLVVLRLIVENYKILSAVNITPDGTFNLITGKNGQGKTSLIESIMVGLLGPSAAPDKPVKDGESKCVITIELGALGKTEVTIKRTFNSKGGHSLEVVNSDGKVSKPQDFINAMIGDLCFDPLAFMRLDAKKQMNRLMVALGLDPDSIDADKKRLSNERLLIGREVKALEGALNPAITKPPTAKPDDTPVNIDDVKAKSAEFRAEWDKANALDRDIAAYDTPIATARDRISTAEQQIKDLQAKILSWKFDISEAESQRTVIKTRRDAMKLTSLDTLDAEIETAMIFNASIEYAKQYAQKKVAVKEKQAEYDTLTRQMDALESSKAAAIKKAKLPIEGLTFSEDELQLGGIPLKQCSASQQLKASVMIASALNPRVRVLLIEDGSLLDEDSKREMLKWAREAGFQDFMEMVSDKSKVGFVIEEGAVVSVQQPGAALFEE
jgi:DNA repair exonuclease SbcCD ATPase subunit